MDYTEFYYSQVVGHYPFDTDDYKNKTSKVFQHLIDAGIDEADILCFIEECPPKDYLTYDDLPDSLWEKSLLKRDTFYYHNTLHVKPPAPIFNPHTGTEKIEKFYLEMRIKYTMDDLIDYFYRTVGINLDLMDRKKDKGAFLYLLNRYSRLDFIEGLDFVLALIDYYRPSNGSFQTVQNVLDIAQAQVEVYEELKRKTAEASFLKANEILWR